MHLAQYFSQHLNEKYLFHAIKLCSQELMLELTKSGLSREKSYKIVQNYAKKCFAEDIDLISIVMKDKFIMSKISPKKLRSIFSYSKHFKNVNLIFRRVFK